MASEQHAAAMQGAPVQRKFQAANHCGSSQHIATHRHFILLGVLPYRPAGAGTLREMQHRSNETEGILCKRAIA